MNKKTIIISVIILIIVTGAVYLFAQKSGYISDDIPNDLPPMTQNELIRYKLINGTPEQKEEVLTNFMSKLQKFKVATTPKEKQTNIASFTPYIPSIIEAILDDTTLPQHEDTGWGNVYHFAATIMSRFAYEIDEIERGRDPKFSFYDSVGTADETVRKSVHDNWLAWWNAYKEITVIFPNGGETLEIGKTYKIVWESKNIPPSGKVNIFYSYGKNSGTIAVGIPNSGSYSWKVSEVKVLGEEDKPSPTGPFYISISHEETRGEGWEPFVELTVDWSDGPFTIVTAH